MSLLFQQQQQEAMLSNLDVDSKEDVQKLVSNSVEEECETDVIVLERQTSDDSSSNDHHEAIITLPVFKKEPDSDTITGTDCDQEIGEIIIIPDKNDRIVPVSQETAILQEDDVTLNQVNVISPLPLMDTSPTDMDTESNLLGATGVTSPYNMSPSEVEALNDETIPAVIDLFSSESHSGHHVTTSEKTSECAQPLIRQDKPTNLSDCLLQTIQQKSSLPMKKRIIHDIGNFTTPESRTAQATVTNTKPKAKGQSKSGKGKTKKTKAEPRTITTRASKKTEMLDSESSIWPPLPPLDVRVTARDTVKLPQNRLTRVIVFIH